MAKQLTGPINVGLINREFFPNDLDDLHYINQGRCWLWAYIAFRLYPRVELWTTGVHAFVRFQGKFYDSERPLGEEDHNNLPANSNRIVCSCPSCRIPGQPLTREQFITDAWWGRHAWGMGINFDELDTRVEKFINAR